MAAAAAAGMWWLSRGKTPIKPRLPSSWSGWMERLEGLLEQFEQLQAGPAGPETAADQQLRRQRLQELRDRQPRRQLQVGLAGMTLPPAGLQPALTQALRAPLPLCLHWGYPLSGHSSDWRWPQLFERCDLLLFHLEPPCGRLICVGLKRSPRARRWPCWWQAPALGRSQGCFRNCVPSCPRTFPIR